MQMLNCGFTFGKLNPATYYNIHGNTPLDSAQVICIADVPTDATIRSNNQALVNHIWRYHRVLVDDIPYGKAVSVWQSTLLRHVKIITQAYGCDAPISETLCQSLESKAAMIREHSIQIKKDLQNKRWGSFFSHDSFHQLLAIMSSKIQQQKDELLKLLDSGQNEAFSYRISLLIKEIEREHQDEIITAYATLFRERLIYLQISIDEAVQISGKVIVCLSGNFVIGNPRLQGDAYDRSGFIAYLNRLKYVVINAKSSPLYMENNPTLWDRVSAAPLISPPSASLAPFSYPVSELLARPQLPWNGIVSSPAASSKRIRYLTLTSSEENPDNFEISWSVHSVMSHDASLPFGPEEESNSTMPAAAALPPMPFHRRVEFPSVSRTRVVDSQGRPRLPLPKREPLLLNEETLPAPSKEPESDDRISAADFPMTERTSAAINRSHQEQA